ncbi:hypothetical protein [Niallia circulans]|nr:hypothetical protein [Niallia circulans]
MKTIIQETELEKVFISKMKTTIQKTELEKGVHKQDENHYSRDRARKRCS